MGRRPADWREPLAPRERTPDDFAIGEEIAPAYQLDRVLGRSDERNRVQARVHQAAEEAFALHGRHHRRQRDGPSNPRDAARDPPRQPGSTPAHESIGRCHTCLYSKIAACSYTEAMPDVLIIGGGFGGLYAARHFRRQPVNVTIVDKRNHHVFQPLLYQVAMAALSPG